MVGTSLENFACLNMVLFHPQTTKILAGYIHIYTFRSEIIFLHKFEGLFNLLFSSF